MFNTVLKTIFGTKNDRELKQMSPAVELINDLEPNYRSMSDKELMAQTPLLKKRLEKGEQLDDILPEAFAVVRETSCRVLGMRPFDTQIVGGIVLHKGKIAEMKTGEGKTLVATMPVYLNALTGRGVHVVTVNDYLARRDSEWMGKIYNFLGLSVGVIVHGLNEKERKDAYNADITYGTNNEFGFDYLRDNMKFEYNELVQRDYFFSIVDEVDSILIDEARTPLIISGPAEQSTDLYYQIDKMTGHLKKEDDYVIDEKSRSVSLTEDGVTKTERLLSIENLYDPSNIETLHHVNQALKAHSLFKRDIDYIVKDNEVIIVDEFTGRLMPGRRYSDGLHQALEAKEHVKIESENQTLASITFQNYFRMYDKLAGMTGTADTEAAEFKKIYNLDVVIVPTNAIMIRKDHPDMIFKTKKEKYDAVVDEIIKLHKKEQPVLVGTISIEDSEFLHNRLKKTGIPHHVLNAKYHEKEAEIISMAGQKGAITISTNMAGRGTDIVLGDGVKPLGGLHIIGTERHESRRIDNQLRGRSGRQGDMGSSRFYLSLDDDLMRIFASEKMASIMGRIGMEDGEPIEHTLISRAIENAQKRVEGQNFEIRKHLLEYDDVMNKQREVIYSQRREILRGKDLKETLVDFAEEFAENSVDMYIDDNARNNNRDMDGLLNTVKQAFAFTPNLPDNKDELTKETITKAIISQAEARYEERTELFGSEIMRRLEQWVLLQSVDNLWKDHLLTMDHLKEGIGLRGYGQKNPLEEYKREGFEIFSSMIDRIKEESVKMIFTLQIASQDNINALEDRQKHQPMYYGRSSGGKVETVKRKGAKIGRNEPCPCGSGKKYKKCCGRTA